MISMTGYAHALRRTGIQEVEVILRAHNYKYLEVTVRNLPQDKILLEEKIKKEVGKYINRGKLEVFIFVRGTVQGDVCVNEAVIAKYVRQVKLLAKKYGLEQGISVRDMLSLPHVIGWRERKGQEENIIFPAVQAGVRALLEFKRKEGNSIKKEMLANLHKLKINVAKIKAGKPGADNEGEKEDIDEEISLMLFYIEKLEKLIESIKSGPKGKSIDFLVQEILRELNTSSSKTRKVALSSMIVESKNYLERIREQAQNVE